jgi:hypothetical protein
MSEEKISLEWLGNRVLVMSGELRDMQLRFDALERRFSALESRVSTLERLIAAQFDTLAVRLDGIERRQVAQEERTSRMLALLVRIAERLDGGNPPPVPQ